MWRALPSCPVRYRTVCHTCAGILPSAHTSNGVTFLHMMEAFLRSVESLMNCCPFFAKQTLQFDRVSTAVRGNVHRDEFTLSRNVLLRKNFICEADAREILILMRKTSASKLTDGQRGHMWHALQYYNSKRTCFRAFWISFEFITQAGFVLFENMCLSWKYNNAYARKSSLFARLGTKAFIEASARAIFRAIEEALSLWTGS